MDSWIVCIRPYLEALYFLASIGLVIGVLISFRQLSLIKRDIEYRSARTMSEKALEAIECYSSKFVPLSGVFYDDWKSYGTITAYEGPIGSFWCESVPQKHLENSKKRYKLDSWLPALNQLDFICAIFVTGVADEKVGFKYLGRSLCFWVERNYDLVALSRREKAFPHWQSIVELYALWRPRLEKAELELQRDDLIARIKAVVR